MIEVTGVIGRSEVFVLRVTNMMSSTDFNLADYSVHLAVRDRDGTEHLYQRVLIGYDRIRYNALGILKAVLDSLEEKVFFVDNPEAEATVPADLARRLPRGMPEV